MERASAEAVATVAHAQSAKYAEWAVKETGFGVAEHKTIKNQACSLGVFERYRDNDFVSPRLDPAAKIMSLPRPAGVVLALVLFGNVLVDLVVVALAVGAVVCARAAFRVRVGLPAAPRPHQPVLLFNPRSGGGKATRLHLEDEARARGIAAEGSATDQLHGRRPGDRGLAQLVLAVQLDVHERGPVLEQRHRVVGLVELFAFADVEEIGAGDIADLNKSTLVGYLPVGSGEPTRGGYP